MSATKATPLVLGEKHCTLRFTNRALMALEDQTGLTFFQLSAALAAGSFKATVHLVWAGLLHEQPKLTVGEVADLIDIRELESLGVAVSAALEAALGPAKKEEEGQEGGNPPQATG